MSAVQLAVLLGEPELLEVSKVAAYVLWTKSWALQVEGFINFDAFQIIFLIIFFSIFDFL